MTKSVLHPIGGGVVIGYVSFYPTAFATVKYLVPNVPLFFFKAYWTSDSLENLTWAYPRHLPVSWYLGNLISLNYIYITW